MPRRHQPRLAAAAAAAAALLALAAPAGVQAQQSWRGGANVGDSGAGNNSNVLPANPSLQTDQAHIQNQSNAGVAGGAGGAPGGAAPGAGDAAADAGSTATKKMPPHPNPAAAQAAAEQSSGTKEGQPAGSGALVGSPDPGARSGANGPGEAASLRQDRGAVGAAASQPSGAGGNGLLQGNDQGARVATSPPNATGDSGGAEETRQRQGAVAGDDKEDAGGIPLVPKTTEGGGQ